MKNMTEKTLDVAIIGAGPVGLASAIEVKRQGLEALLFEKGVAVNSIFHFPTFMTFFTTADLLEIGTHPFPSTAQKPTRQMALDYYRGVVKNEELRVLQHHEVTNIGGKEGAFEIMGTKRIKGETLPFKYNSRFIIVATGYYDNPAGLGGIPGEEGKNTSYYYTEPHQFYDHDVVVIGAGNSGAEAALDLYRHGARVTLVHRHPEPRSTLKYWVGPDLRNRLKAKEIRGVMPANVKEITPRSVNVLYKGREESIPADFVFILTGFTPNVARLNQWEIKTNTQDLSVPLSETFECNRKGIFVIGSAGCGKATNKVFIENGREHAKIAATEITNRCKNIP